MLEGTHRLSHTGNLGQPAGSPVSREQQLLSLRWPPPLWSVEETERPRTCLKTRQTRGSAPGSQRCAWEVYSGEQDPSRGSKVRAATDERGAVPRGGDDTHDRGSSGVRTQGCERKEARAPQAVLSTSMAPQHADLSLRPSGHLRPGVGWQQLPR